MIKSKVLFNEAKNNFSSYNINTEKLMVQKINASYMPQKYS